MKVLFLGGTGVVSAACTRLALSRGFEVMLLNRGRREAVPGALQLSADIGDSASTAAAIGNRSWDVVVDFIAYTPADVEQRLALFRKRVGQYIFISTASVYQKPPSHYLVTESTPLANPYSPYARNKIACEERLSHALRDEAFPVTIVRPSSTYDHTIIPLAISIRNKAFTIVDRMRRGLPLIVPGDGTSLWTITHNTDFAKGLVGLLGQSAAIGHAFHITSDESLTWDQLYRAVADAAGAPEPRFVHIASDFIVACLPDQTANLFGDKVFSVVFDNTKIRRFVPDFVATTRFRDGVARAVSWYDAEPARQQIDEGANAVWDRLIAAYARGLAAAQN
jgi:nucleoside-diphosphate-sugar epimerase